MRRALLVITFLILALLAWIVLTGGFGGQDVAPRAADDAVSVDDAPEDVARERVRPEEQAARRTPPRRSGNAFQQDLPELGQDLPQDPALGAVKGRVMIDRTTPAGGGVLEASTGARLLARVHVPADGRFLLKNVPPGLGYAVLARHDGRAPGGMDRINVTAGQTVDVGTIFVGAAIGPGVDNSVRVVVLDESGAPIRGAEVTATTIFYGALLSLGPMEKQPGGTLLRKTTDASGEALFEILPPAAYDIFANAEGRAFQVRQRVTIQKDTKARYELRLEPGLRIAGTVVDEAGSPVAGARIGGLRWNEFTSVPAVESDAEGRFALEGLRGGQPYFVFAAKAELGGKQVQNIQAGTEDLVIEIPTGGSVTLKVVDAATDEVVPAFLLRPFQSVPFAYLYAPALEVEADAEGLFRLHMSAGEYGLEVSADGYALNTVAGVKIPAESVQVVRLEPAGVVHGRVVSKVDGTPVVGADVFVKKGGFPPSKVKDLVTTTDADGRFVLDRLPPRTLSLWVSHVDHTEALFEGIEPQVRDGDELPPPQDLRLGSGGRIEGRVFDDASAPMVGETIQLSSGFDFMSARNATTDAEGRYAFKNVPLDKTYTVSVGAFVPGRTGRSKSGVTVSEGAVTTVDFGTESGGVPVTGVVMRDDTPVANASISLVSDDGGDALVQEVTDSAGRFTFPTVQAGRYRITVNRRGNVSETIVVGAEPPAEVRIDLPTAEITGAVVDGDGAPVSGAYVECERIASGGTNNLSRLSQVWAGNAVTAADGAFTIRGLGDDRYRIRAQAAGYGTVVSEDLVVKDGASVTGVRLRMPPSCTVTGFVRNGEGTPISGASLTILDAQGRAMTLVDLSQSSSDGSYAASQLAPGTYTLTFNKDGYAPASKILNVVPGSVVTADFALLAGGRIDLTVLDPDGRPVKGAVVVVLDSDGQPLRTSFTLENLFSTSTIRTDAQGKVTVPGLAPGRYRLRVRNGEAESTSDVAEVFEKGTTLLEVRVLGKSAQ